MSNGWVIFVAVAGWVAFIATIRFAIVPWLAHGPEGDPVIGLMWRLIRTYARLVHRVRFVGQEELRDRIHAGPLIVVSNHTGSVDPLLIQAGCRFHIRWMMASEMMTPWLEFLWAKTDPIPVERTGRDLSPAREAIRHIQAGGVVGIFPEGRIVSPPRQIRPFYTGVGLIVSRAQAPVLLVWVSGTPETRSLTRSLLTPSHAQVRFVEIIDFNGERDAHVITRQLRERLASVSGWPLNDEPQPD
jgi:1-acyl-sn-glycerol-3-phosphate acyltransferase